MNLRGLLVIVFSWIYVTIYTSAFIIFTICTLGIFTRYVWHIATRGWGMGLFKIAGIKLEVLGIENKNAKGPRIIIYNHQSMLDVVWIAGTLVPKAIAVVKKEFKYIPFINLAFWLAGFIFIDRKKRDQAITKMKASIAKIKKHGYSLYVAPEGTRSLTDQLLPFKKGSFHLALMGELPIYPVVVYGAHQLLPKGSIVPRSGKLTLKWLSPIDTKDWNMDNLNTKIANIREVMQNELQILAKQGGHHD